MKKEKLKRCPGCGSTEVMSMGGAFAGAGGDEVRCVEGVLYPAERLPMDVVGDVMG